MSNAVVNIVLSLPNISSMSTQDTRKTVRNGSNQWTKHRAWQRVHKVFCMQTQMGCVQTMQQGHWPSPEWITIPSLPLMMMLMTVICLDTAAGCPAPATATVRAVCSRIEM